MSKNPLLKLERLGQAVWLDFISQPLLRSGELANLIQNDHLSGVTSNPSIFANAIAKTNDYDDAIISAIKHGKRNANDIYEALAIADIQEAADLVRPVFDKTNGRDGFVSLEVSPHLAHDTNASVAEGKRLWQEVARDNLMIKVPGTTAGFKAIEQLIADGISVNVTLLFSTSAYKNAATAYLNGLQDRHRRGRPLNSVQSVASFFISRIDSAIDKKLLAINDAEKTIKARKLVGKTAIANAKIAYSIFHEIYKSSKAQELLQADANPQRLLWASTSTKNPNYKDVLYVESLVGKYTVNTMPPKTLEAFRHHGVALESVNQDLPQAQSHFEEIRSMGIDFDAECDELLEQGIKIFGDSFDELIRAVAEKAAL